MRVAIVVLVFAGMLSGAALAAPVSETEARKLLFPVLGADLVVRPDSGLDATQLAIVEAILKQMRSEAAANYYGAVAVSPAFFDLMTQDPGQAALSGLLQISERFHGVQSAGEAAMAACDKARRSGQARCTVAALVLPKKWTSQPLQMSVGATEAFRDYRKGDGPKAFAISPSTTAFAAARGTTAAAVALDRCNAAATPMGAADCEIVIED